MRRAGRRRALEDEETMHGEDGSAPMSPDTLKRHYQEGIMLADLGEVTADHIKTVDYGKPKRQDSLIPIMRKCDLAGTKEATLASQNKDEAQAWKAWGQSDEAFETSFGETPVGNGNVHRSTMTSRIREEEARIGRAMTVEDTYEERGWKRPHGYNASTMAMPPQPKSHQMTAPSKATPVPPAPKGGQRTFQSRERPPPALLNPPARAIQAPARPLQQQPPLVDGSLFMTQAMASMASWKTKVTAPTNGLAVSAAPTPVAHEAATFVSSDPVAREPKNPLIPNDESIRQVPVGDFSFPLRGALAQAQVSTHTDGVPSPDTLSPFSLSDTSQERPLIDEAREDGPVGLGTQVNDWLNAPAETGSRHGTILDSPSLNIVESDVLLNLSIPEDQVITVNGVRFVQESEYLRLKELLEGMFQSEIPNSSRRSSVQSTTLEAEQVPRSTTPVTTQAAQPEQALTVPVLAPASQPSLTNTTEPSTMMSPPSAAHLNPFDAREPLLASDSNAEMVMPPVAARKVAHLGPAYLATPEPRPAFVPAKATTGQRENLLPSRWANAPPEPRRRPSVQPAKDTRAPIFGNHRVFGHLSAEAAQPGRYDAPEPKQRHGARAPEPQQRRGARAPEPKQRRGTRTPRQQPGPGFDALKARLDGKPTASEDYKDSDYDDDL